MSQDAIHPETDVETTGSPEEDVMVEVRNLKTYYGGDKPGPLGGRPVRAVDGVTFDIKRGETLGLVGESGCGKTTLGRTLIQLENATDGTVRFDGTDVTTLKGYELKQWRRNAQMVFQDPDSSLNDRMTVGEIIREPLDVHEWGTPRERRQRVRDLLDTVGLQREHYYRYPHQFSGGQRQRIGIARTLALEPEFIVLDEPVSALDVSVQAEVINLLEELQDEFGLTYLFIAHDLSVVRHICDRVAVMYLGEIVEIAETDELFAIPEPDPTSEKERITLHGTPPNPRYPPDGCPFSTRCPARIRPPEYEDMDDEIWQAITTFEEVIRERMRADRTIRERLRGMLGFETRYSSIEEIYEELFGDVQVPARIEPTLDEVAEHVGSNDERTALDVLKTEFGGACQKQKPEYYTVSDSGRRSFCHRHDPEYRSPEQTFDDRHR